MVWLLAIACGASVANLYYAQPLLHPIAQALHTSSSTAALLVTASQVGYAAGLLFLVPLGDLLHRRRLVCRMLIVAAAALVLAAVAPSLGVLALAIAIAGLTSTVAQVLVPFAGTLATDDERGKVVGQVMSGLLTGILVARTFRGNFAAGAIASAVAAALWNAGGWGAVCAFGGGLSAIGLLVWLAGRVRLVPDVRPGSRTQIVSTAD
jgi:MFS family permease